MAAKLGAVGPRRPEQLPNGKKLFTPQQSAQQSPLEQLPEVLVGPELQSCSLFHVLPGF